MERMHLGLSSIPLTDYIFELMTYFCINEEIPMLLCVGSASMSRMRTDSHAAWEGWRITCRRSSFRPSTDLAVRENKYSIHFLTQSSIHPVVSAVTKWSFLGSRSTTLVRWPAGFPADVILTPSISGNLPMVSSGSSSVSHGLE